MISLFIPLLVFALTFGGAMLGVFLQRTLPDHHLDEKSKENIQLVMGLIATMAALVLSLLIASSHAFFQTQEEEVQKLAADAILVDMALAHYGAETKDIRQAFREDVLAAVQKASPDEGLGSLTVSAAGTIGQQKHLFEQVFALDPQTKSQQFDQSKTLDLMSEITKTRLLIHEQVTSTVPAVLVSIMIAWLMFLFIGFGLFARINATVFSAIGLGAVSVAGAVFLILDMSHPYRGLIRVSGEAIQSALTQLGR